MNSKATLTALDILFVVSLIGFVITFALADRPTVVPYSEFLNNLQQGKVKQVVVSDQDIVGDLKVGPKEKPQRFVVHRVDPQLADKLAQSGATFSGEPESFWATLWRWFAAGFLVMVLLSLFSAGRTNAGGIGGAGGIFSIEKNRARVYSESKITTTFSDVAGVDEAKEELREVVKFLKEPQQYTRLGGRLPKGILLVGPPGTGKTLLARAVAGEAGVPFFSISGSEFVELFVGVGAARVRDLFAQARNSAPCIIFIDELDALGRSRAPGTQFVTHDEKEQTLNQLLVELDGFDTSGGVVLLSATNRPEILDPALLRAGRFDRQVSVDRPDKKGRIEILNVHLRKVVIDEAFDVPALAAMTPGCTGADLANIVNEAALLAARRGAKKVEQMDFENAVERMIAGLEKRSRLLSEPERQRVAYHEMGHALVAMNLSGLEEVQKVTIIPRGVAALGYTLQRPIEDRFLQTRTELLHKLTQLIAGRAAECLIFGEPSTGAVDDLQKATLIARAMISQYGMDERIGLMSAQPLMSPFLANGESLPYGEDISKEIDCSVQRLLNDAYADATRILTDNREWLKIAADLLLIEETLTKDQILQCKPHPETSFAVPKLPALLTVLLLILIMASLFIPSFAKEWTPLSASPSSREGRRLVLEMNCMSCHSIGGRGGDSAPCLDGIGAGRSRKFIETQILNPNVHRKSKKRGSKMVQQDLFQNDAKAITDYLLTLPSKPHER